jgi:hypothetical protein
MRQLCHILFTALLLVPLAALDAADAPPNTAAQVVIPMLAPAVAGFSEETISPHPHVTWASVQSADAYRIQLARSDDFTNPLLDDTVHSVIHWFVVAKPLASGAYRWRVRAERDDGTAGPWSDAQPLTVIEAARTFDVTPATPLDELRRIAREAAAGPSARIRLAKGSYRWDPGFQQAVFAWKGARNLIVEGNGATITLADPSSQLFHLDVCHTVVIRDLQVSHEPTPYSALEVVAVDPAGEWFEGRVLAGFSEERYPREVNQFFVYAVAPGDFMKKHPDRPGHTYLAWDKTRRIAPGVFRFHTREVAERGAMKQLRPGDKALACYRRWALNLMSGCRDVAWSGVVGGISEGSLFMGGDNADIKFLGLINKSPATYFPSAPGWVTGNDRRGPWIQDCEWEGMTDDGPNLTGNSYLIDRAIDGSQFEVSTGPGYQTSSWQAGDELLFWNPADGRPLTESRVKTASRDGNRISFSVVGPVEGLSPGRDLRLHTHVYNLSTQNRQLVIRSNRMVGGRRFGFNVKSISALIDRNRFQDIASCAVYLENEPTCWEGIVNRHVVIQDNFLTGCGYDAHSRALGRANIHVNTWHPGRGLDETDWIGNEGILIRRNTIENWSGIAIGVDNAEEVTIRENTFHSPGPLGAEPVRVSERTTRVVR